VDSTESTTWKKRRDQGHGLQLPLKDTDWNRMEEEKSESETVYIYITKMTSYCVNLQDTQSQTMVTEEKYCQTPVKITLPTAALKPYQHRRSNPSHIEYTMMGFLSGRIFAEILLYGF